MTKWSDVTDWPPLDSLASQGYSIISVNLEKLVETADKDTKAAFDNYRNQFVQQNCHRDVEIRYTLTHKKHIWPLLKFKVSHLQDLGHLGHS